LPLHSRDVQWGETEVVFGERVGAVIKEDTYLLKATFFSSLMKRRAPKPVSTVDVGPSRQ
jgi:hypothetical protein